MVVAIRDTMPPGNVGNCEQACAEDVAAYIKRVLFAEREVEELDQPPLAARLAKPHYINTVQDLFNITLSNDEKSLIPDELADEGGFVTVFDSQPIQSGHLLAYAKISRLIAEQLDMSNFTEGLVSCSDTNNTCRNAFVDELGLHVFRRPLTDEETSAYRTIFTEIQTLDGASFDDSAAAVLRAMLQAPQFLYRTEEEIADTASFKTVKPYELASRLSFFIWQSAPDTELLDFAQDMEFNGFDEEAYEAQVNRLFADAKGARSLDAFWSDYTLSSTSSIQQASASDAEALRESIVRTLKRASGDGAAAIPLQELFTSTEMVLSAEQAQDMGLNSLGDGYENYDVSNADERVGFLSHPGFLANIGSTSFVGRGTVLSNRILCREIPDTPANVADEIENAAARTENLTPREASEYRFDLGGSCSGCHKFFEPVAAAFEQFDVLGGYASEDSEGRPLFTDGYLQAFDGGIEDTYSDVEDLMFLLEQSEETSECFVSNMMLFGIGRHYAQRDANAISATHDDYLNRGGNYEGLLKAVALNPLFRSIQTVTE